DHAEPFATIAAVEHALAPVVVVQIPIHRLGDAALEAFTLAPAELRLELAGLDCVTAIVAGAILHVGDQRLALCAISHRPALVEQPADGFHHDDVLAL